MKQKYEVYARVVNIYEVEAESFEEALDLASEMEDPTDSINEGYECVVNTYTGKELIL